MLRQVSTAVVLAVVALIIHRSGYFNPETIKTTKTPNLHLFLPITKASIENPLRAPLFCKTLLAAIVSGYDPILYNWDVDRRGRAAHKAKVFGLLGVMRNRTAGLREDDIVVMADALDVWFQLPPEELVRRFKYTGKQVIIGAEKQCYPNRGGQDCANAPASVLPEGLFEHTDLSEGYDDEPYSTVPRHANSGFVVGRLQAMVPAYERLEAILSDPLYLYQRSDQGAFNMLVGRGELEVDQTLSLVWCSVHDEDSILYLNHPPASDTTKTSPIPWDLYPPLGKHIWTGETPVAIHYNGKQSKHLLAENWSEAWYGSNARGFQNVVREILRGKTVRTIQAGGVVRIPASDLCAAYLPVFGSTENSSESSKESKTDGSTPSTEDIDQGGTTAVDRTAEHSSVHATPEIHGFELYHSGCGKTENDNNPGWDERYDKSIRFAPPQTFPGANPAKKAIQDCAFWSEYKGYHSFQIFYESGIDMWNCTGYPDVNTDGSYFDVENPRACPVYGYSE